VTERILGIVDVLSLPHVQLIGGEVSLIPDLHGLIGILKKTRWRSLVTNGRVYIDNLAGLIDEIFLSLHGQSHTHESLTRARGSFAEIEDHIRTYVADGIRVNADTVLTRQNAAQIFDVACHAHRLGMSMIFVNIFQPAGIGAHFATGLTPTLDQVRSAIGQLIKAHRDTGIAVSFGTSTPYCLDERLLTEGLAFTCGTGTWFGSIDPWGEFRICNQSGRSYGNVLEKPFKDIWHAREIHTEYRSLDWMDEPCTSCSISNICLGGCRITDSGTPRVDPFVAKYRDQLVKDETLKLLMPEYLKRDSFL
jgi:pyrroloquinoline quinone biosynthesis protein E